MIDLIIGIDGVQRTSRRSFHGQAKPARKRRVAHVRRSAAAGLRAPADRIEPIGAGRASEPAGAHPR
jgi:hypothetical protein